jgi:uncharacterized protein (TIGR02599 family)
MKLSSGKFLPQDGAFTLVELLVSMVILVLLLLMLVSITDSTRRTWIYTTGKVEQFRDSRDAFETMTRRISQATLNTYWDYNNPNNPTSYLRQSELRFISGPSSNLLTGLKDLNNANSLQTNTHAIFFQAPIGLVSNTGYSQLENLLNTWGYYIEYVNDSSLRPGFITQQMVPYHTRFRLMEMMEPSDNLTVYQYSSGLSGTYPNNYNYVTNPVIPNSGWTQPTSVHPPAGTTGLEWFTTPFAHVGATTGLPDQRRVIADNVVALIILPQLSQGDEQALITSGTLANPLGSNLAPDYVYDSTMVNVNNANINSRNQLPPQVVVTMVAVDEASFNRLPAASATTLFTTPNPAPFTSSSQYATDLQSLQNNLQADQLNYRVFSTTVSLKAAKWSRSQTN